MGGNNKSKSSNQITSILKAIQNEMQSDRKEAKNRHKELKTSLDAVTRKYGKLKSKVDDVETKQIQLAKTVDIMKGQMNSIQQQQLTNNLIIRGVKEVESDANGTLILVKEILKLMGLDSKSFNFKVRRLGNQKPGQNRPIVMEVQNNADKLQIIQKKRQTRINLSMIKWKNESLGSTNDIIYIDDHLTQESARLFASARKLKEIGVKYIWTKNGKILAKIGDDSIPTTIQSNVDIEKISTKVKPKPKLKKQSTANESSEIEMFSLSDNDGDSTTDEEQNNTQDEETIVRDTVEKPKRTTRRNNK